MCKYRHSVMSFGLGEESGEEDLLDSEDRTSASPGAQRWPRRGQRQRLSDYSLVGCATRNGSFGLSVYHESLILLSIPPTRLYASQAFG